MVPILPYFIRWVGVTPTVRNANTHICVFGQLACYVRLPQLGSYCISIVTGTLNTVKSDFHIWNPARIGMHLVCHPGVSVWILTRSGGTPYWGLHEPFVGSYIHT